MKKIFLVLAIIIMFTIPSLAEAEMILSLNAGMKTGFMGFTLERLNNLVSGEVGFGITNDTIRLSVGSRLYFPDNSQKIKTRSNVYMNPSLGIVWEWMGNYDYNDNFEPTLISTGYQSRYWLGLNMGYDLRWGPIKQYRLAIEGGFGVTNEDRFIGIPMVNLSLGYVF